METRKLTDKVKFREIRILGDDKTHQTAIVTGRPEMLLSSNHPEVDAADDLYPENRLSVTRLRQEA